MKADDYRQLRFGGLAPVALIFAAVLCYHLVRIPYESFERYKAALAVAQNVPSTKNRSIGDFAAVVNAFRQFRGALGDEQPKVLVTAPDTGEMYMTFITAAVMGSNVGNGNLANIGIPESRRGEAEADGSKPGMVVVHANTDLPWALTLVSNLKTVLPVERSFDFPTEVDNATVWIQIGEGVKWNADPRK